VEEKHLITILIFLLSIIIIFIIIYVFNSIKKDKTVSSPDRIYKKDKKIITIKDMVDIVADRNSSQDDLAKAVIKVANEFPFPPKVKGKVTKEIKVYLNFVLLLASHKKADAKLVAFMNSELKKKNPDFTKEIDLYESEGITQRGKRI